MDPNIYRWNEEYYPTSYSNHAEIRKDFTTPDMKLQYTLKGTLEDIAEYLRGQGYIVEKL